MSTINDVVTVQQVAERLGVSGPYVRRVCRENNIGDKITENMRLLSNDDYNRFEKIHKEKSERPEGSLTVKEVAERLDVTTGRIRQLCKEHNIGEINNGLKYISKKEVVLLQKARKAPGRPKTKN